MTAPDSVGKALKLLEQITSLDVMRGFLKAKGLHHSAGSWKALKEDRIYPAIESGNIELSELVSLLSEAEEHGRQHIFQYMVSNDTAKTLISRTRITKIAQEQGLEKIIDQADVVEKPDIPTFSCIRWDDEGTEKESLTIKIIRSRSTRKKIRTKTKGTFEFDVYQRVVERAINLIKICSSGCVEVRLSSLSSSTQYEEELGNFWSLITPFIGWQDLILVSLSNAKDNLWAKKEELSKADTVRFTSARLKDDLGGQIKVDTGSENDDILANQGATASVSAFVEHGGYVDTNNVWFLEKEGELSKSQHVILAGQTNEFSISRHCTKSDYDYVIKQIRKLNR